MTSPAMVGTTACRGVSDEHSTLGQQQWKARTFAMPMSFMAPLALTKSTWSAAERTSRRAWSISILLRAILSTTVPCSYSILPNMTLRGSVTLEDSGLGRHRAQGGRQCSPEKHVLERARRCSDRAHAVMQAARTQTTLNDLGFKVSVESLILNKAPLPRSPGPSLR